MKKRVVLLFMVVLSISILFTACGKTQSSPEENLDSSTTEELSQSVTTDEAFEIINKNKGNKNFILLDVRTQGEYDEFYIEGSIHRPIKEEVAFISSISDISKDSYILVYCRTQNRSKDAYLFMKKNGYKKVQYMYGGITQWAREGKPLVEPFKNEKKAILFKNNIKHQYLNNENLVIDLVAENEKALGEYVNLYKKEIKYSIIKDNQQINQGNIVTDGQGKGRIEVCLQDFSIGKYQLKAEIVDDAYFSIPLFFQFEVVNNVTEEIKSYHQLKQAGNFSEILNINSEYSEEFLKYNILKNISGYSVETFDRAKVTLLEKIQNKPSLLVFGSPTCGSCMDCWDYMSKLDTAEFNIFYILTSINSEEIDSTKADVLQILSDRNIDIDKQNIYFDCVDFIWKNVLKFITTPQIVMLDNNNEVVNFFANDNKFFASLDIFNTQLNAILQKTYGKSISPKETYIELILRVDNKETVYSVEKGNSITNIADPVKKMYKFTGWSDGKNIIDLSTYEFNSDTILTATFVQTAILRADIGQYNSCVIDLRSSEKFNNSHIDGAINIPFDSFKNNFVSMNIGKEKTIILYGADNYDSLFDYIKDKGYSVYYIFDYQESDNKQMTYNDRLVKGEFDPYFANRENEKENLKNHYGDNYLDLVFKDFDKQTITLRDKLQHPNQPTIIMIGSTTCGACIQPWNEFLAMKDTFKYNFIESVIFGGTEEDKTIDYQLSLLEESQIPDHKKYKVFDIKRYYGAGDHPLYARETPIFYVLDKLGNLTNLTASFSNALSCVTNLNGTISVKNIDTSPDGTISDKQFSQRDSAGEFVQIKNDTTLYNMIKSSYAKYVLKDTYYDYVHNVKNVGAFFRANEYDFNNPTVIYIMNSSNPDFETDLAWLDSSSMLKNPAFNFLIALDDSSPYQNSLIAKPYASKIMFDYDCTNIIEHFTLYSKSYFAVLDSSGNVTNAFINYNDYEKIINYTTNTKSVLSPNEYTLSSVVKQGDDCINKNDAFNNGWISHLDSTKDNARYEYLDVNFGRNYSNIEVIDKNNKWVKISTLVDNTRPTILCYLQDYQDDFYYTFTPLLKLADKANIIIVFTNRRDTQYNQEYVDYIINLAEQKAVAKAKEPQNYTTFENIVLQSNPSLSGEELAKAVDKFIVDSYNYSSIRPYIYGSYAYLTTPILQTEVRGIQLYLDRNGNLANISQSYYAVGNTFKSVLETIGNKIAVEN